MEKLAKNSVELTFKLERLGKVIPTRYWCIVCRVIPLFTDYNKGYLLCGVGRTVRRAALLYGNVRYVLLTKRIKRLHKSVQKLLGEREERGLGGRQANGETDTDANANVAHIHIHIHVYEHVACVDCELCLP